MKERICKQCGEKISKHSSTGICIKCYLKNKADKAITKVCEECGKEYQVMPYMERKHQQRGFQHDYCSHTCACRANARAQRTMFCKHCGKPVPRSREFFCSDECETQYRIEHKPKATCKLCGKEFIKASARTQFCSMECKNKYHSIAMTGSGNSHFKKGDSYNKAFIDIKPYILERDGHKCQICGNPEAKMWNDGCITTLRVHHIDENPQNNNEENLITLCAQCHAKIHKITKLSKLEDLQKATPFTIFKLQKIKTSMPTEF